MYRVVVAGYAFNAVIDPGQHPEEKAFKVTTCEVVLESGLSIFELMVMVTVAGVEN